MSITFASPPTVSLLSCPCCGQEIQLIAFVTDPPSIRRILRFAILLRLDVQGMPSLACPLDGTKVHWTFVCIRLALEHLGEPTQPPPLSQPRGPPAWAQPIDQTPLFDPTAGQSEPAFEFDQTINW